MDPACRAEALFDLADSLDDEVPLRLDREDPAQLGPNAVSPRSADYVIPPRVGQALFAAATTPKRWVELDGGHKDGHLASAAQYERALQTFVSEVTG